VLSELFSSQSDLIQQYAAFDTANGKEKIKNEFYNNTDRIIKILSELNFNELYFEKLYDQNEKDGLGDIINLAGRIKIEDKIINMIGQYVCMYGMHNLNKEDIFNDGINQIENLIKLQGKKILVSNYINFTKALGIWIKGKNSGDEKQDFGYIMGEDELNQLKI